MMARICAFCGRPGGFDFATTINKAEKAGVRLKFRFDREGLRNTYLHNGCARQVKRLASLKVVEKRVRERAKMYRDEG